MFKLIVLIPICLINMNLIYSFKNDSDSAKHCHTMFRKHVDAKYIFNSILLLNY